MELGVAEGDQTLGGYPSDGVCAVMAIPGLETADYRDSGQETPGFGAGHTGNRDRNYREWRHEFRAKGPVSQAIPAHNF